MRIAFKGLRVLLVLMLVAMLAASSFAYAEPEDEGTGEDSGETFAAPEDTSWKRTRSFFRDPFEYLFYTFDIASALRIGEQEETETEEAYQFELAEDELASACIALDGAVIGIDPGHQSVADYGLEEITPGSGLTKIRQSAGCAGVRSRTPEYRINLIVSEKLNALFTSCGATVVMTRTTSDITLSNIDRAMLVNSSGADIWIRLHCNAAADCEISGASVLIPCEQSVPDIYAQSLALGTCLSKSLMQLNDTPVDVVALDNQTGFNWSLVPVAALEMGYLSNAADDALLNSDSYQTQCALYIFRGIVDFYTLNAADANSESVSDEPVGDADVAEPVDNAGAVQPPVDGDAEQPDETYDGGRQ